jgi:hypothetical protein
VFIPNGPDDDQDIADSRHDIRIPSIRPVRAEDEQQRVLNMSRSAVHANGLRPRGPSQSFGRARFEQSSIRRDEYDHLNGGGYGVIEDPRGAIGAREARELLTGHKNGRISLMDMASAPLLQDFLRGAQNKLALNGDKFAQRVIVQDDKAQLTFQNLNDFTTGECRRMQLEPSIRYKALEALNDQCALTKRSFEEEIEVLILKADVAAAQEDKSMYEEKKKRQAERAGTASAAMAKSRGGATATRGRAEDLAETGGLAGDDQSELPAGEEDANIEILIDAENEAKHKLRDASVANLRSKSDCKIKELRAKSPLGCYDVFSAYLAEWYRETVEAIYGMMMGFVAYEAIQTLTQKHCERGASNYTNFLVIIDIWFARATRTDVAHVAPLWAKKRFLTTMTGNYTVDGFLAKNELVNAEAAAFPMDEHQEWICHHYLLSRRHRPPTS